MRQNTSFMFCASSALSSSNVSKSETRLGAGHTARHYSVAMSVEYIGLVTVSLQITLGQWAELQLPFNSGKETTSKENSHNTNAFD